MPNDLDHIAELVAARIRAGLGCGPVPATGSAARSCVGDDCRDLRNLADAGAVRFAPPRHEAEQIAADLAAQIDHTLLKPDATRDELARLCEEAKRFAFASVCVNSSNVAYCAKALAGTRVMVCAVVGFPLGAMAPGAKAFESREAVVAGASEIDMVINIGAMKDGEYALVLEDIVGVVNGARPAKVKVILETSKLNDQQKVAACTLAKLAGAHFVKTSTGFGGGGATVADIELMRKVVGQGMGVKASGGVRSQDDALRMIAAGADRIGASSSVAIVLGESGGQGY